MAKNPSHAEKRPGRIALEDIPQNRPLDVSLALSPADLEAMAEDIGAIAVGKFRLAGTLERHADTDISLTATIGASVTQPCVVTFAPVRTRVDDPIRRRFTTLEYPDKSEYHLREDEDVDIDPISDHIDLYEIAREMLILALPAYPRAPDAELRAKTASPPGTTPLTDEAARPFAALAALKAKLGEKDG